MTAAATLPPEWAAAIDAAPDADRLFVVLGTLADWCDENDDPWGGECLRWCVRAGRVPNYWLPEGRRAGMWTHSLDESSPGHLPPPLWKPYDRANGLSLWVGPAAVLYARLMAAWRAARAAGERLPGDGEV